MGLLPGEEEPPPPPTNDQLLDSAQLHPEDHGASIEAADADSDDPDNDDIQDGDASGEGDEGPIVAEKISRPRQAPKLSKHQCDECVARVKEVKAGTADNFMFLSPEPTILCFYARAAQQNSSYVGQPNTGTRVECGTEKERLRYDKGNERKKKKRKAIKLAKEKVLAAANIGTGV